MPSFRVSLFSLDDVKRFVDAAARCPCEIDVRSGRYLVNGKSIMGLCSLDLSQPVEVEILGSGAEAQAFQAAVASLVRPAP